MKWDDFIAQLMLLCACRQIRTTVLYFCCKVGYRWDMKFCFCSLIVIILHDCLHDHHDHHHGWKSFGFDRFWVRESILWQLTGVEEKVRPRSRNSGFEELAAGWGWPQFSRCCSKPGLQWLFVCFRFQCAEVPRCTACVDLLHLPFLIEFRFVLEYHPWGKHTATCNAAWSCIFFKIIF